MTPIRSVSGSAIVRLERPSSAPSLAKEREHQRRAGQRQAGERRTESIEEGDEVRLDKLCASLFAPEPDHLAPNPKDPLAPFRTRVLTVAVEDRMDARADVRVNAARLSGPFARAVPPPIALSAYLSRFVRFAVSQPPTLSLALSLIDRLQESGCPCTPLSVHRLVATTVSLASKMVEEVRVSRSAFCRVAGVDRKELAMLEEVAFQLLHSTVLGSGGERWEHVQAEMARRSLLMVQPNEVRMLRVHAARLGIDGSSRGSARALDTAPVVAATPIVASTTPNSSTRRPTRSSRSTRSLRSNRSRRSAGVTRGAINAARDAQDVSTTTAGGPGRLERARSWDTTGRHDDGATVGNSSTATGGVRRRRRASTIAAEFTKSFFRRRPTWRTRSSSMERASSAPSAARHHVGGGGQASRRDDEP